MPSIKTCSWNLSEQNTKHNLQEEASAPSDCSSSFDLLAQELCIYIFGFLDYKSIYSTLVEAPQLQILQTSFKSLNHDLVTCNVDSDIQNGQFQQPLMRLKRFKETLESTDAKLIASQDAMKHWNENLAARQHDLLDARLLLGHSVDNLLQQDNSFADERLHMLCEDIAQCASIVNRHMLLVHQYSAQVNTLSDEVEILARDVHEKHFTWQESLSTVKMLKLKKTQLAEELSSKEQFVQGVEESTYILSTTSGKTSRSSSMWSPSLSESTIATISHSPRGTPTVDDLENLFPKFEHVHPRKPPPTHSKSSCWKGRKRQTLLFSSGLVVPPRDRIMSIP
eukprot:Platyproteum_vivax@DN4499_c0_g1_i2.p1